MGADTTKSSCFDTKHEDFFAFIDRQTVRTQAITNKYGLWTQEMDCSASFYQMAVPALRLFSAHTYPLFGIEIRDLS